MLGQAALAMWWDMAPAMQREFEHWHTVEHFPERLGLPGFLRASRWADAGEGPGFFVLYELADHATLASPAYLARLNAPTPWSTRLMPHHANMVRCQCEVASSRGAVTGRHVRTLRFRQAPAGLAAAAASVALEWGVTGAHLLRHRAPAIAPTTEQRIRGLADAQADAILLLHGYDAGALQAAADQVLQACGGAGAEQGLYTLSLAMVPADVQAAGISP